MSVPNMREVRLQHVKARVQIIHTYNTANVRNDSIEYIIFEFTLISSVRLLTPTYKYIFSDNFIKQFCHYSAKFAIL